MMRLYARAEPESYFVLWNDKPIGIVWLNTRGWNAKFKSFINIKKLRHKDLDWLRPIIAKRVASYMHNNPNCIDDVKPLWSDLDV